MSLPPSVREWLATQSLDVASTREVASTQGRVFVVGCSDGVDRVVKTGTRAAIDREVWGLECAAAVGNVPRVLGRPDATVVVLSWHGGARARSPATMRAAGSWLRRLHAQPLASSDPLDLRLALERRRDGWLARAGGGLDVSKVVSLDFSSFTGRPRVPCHRDFTPENWLWDPQGGLTIVDFGQSRADAALWDLVKLEGETFRRQPQLRAPFYAAYGTLAAEEAVGLRALVLLHGLQTAVWGDLHDHPGFSALGREILGA